MQQQQALDNLIPGIIDAYGTGDVGCQYVAERSPEQLTIANIYSSNTRESLAFALRVASHIETTLNHFIECQRQYY